MPSSKLLLALPLLAACAVQTGGAAQPTTATPTEPAAGEPSAPSAAATSDDWQSQPETDAHRATYDGRTVIEKPGPDPRRRDGGQDVCDAAHNHCLHSNSWFLTGGPGMGPHDAVLVFRFEGHFYGWKDSDERNRGVAYRTEPATAGNVKPGAKVMVFHPMDSDEWAPPRRASEARDWQNWGLLDVATVDSAAGTFRTPSGKRDFPLALARVVVEEVAVSQ
jgi:hypothetical protein